MVVADLSLTVIVKRLERKKPVRIFLSDFSDFQQNNFTAILPKQFAC